MNGPSPPSWAPSSDAFRGLCRRKRPWPPAMTAAPAIVFSGRWRKHANPRVPETLGGLAADARAASSDKPVSAFSSSTVPCATTRPPQWSGSSVVTCEARVVSSCPTTRPACCRSRRQRIQRMRLSRECDRWWARPAHSNAGWNSCANGCAATTGQRGRGAVSQVVQAHFLHEVQTARISVVAISPPSRPRRSPVRKLYASDSAMDLSPAYGARHAMALPRALSWRLHTRRSGGFARLFFVKSPAGPGAGIVRVCRVARTGADRVRCRKGQARVSPKMLLHRRCSTPRAACSPATPPPGRCF